MLSLEKKFPIMIGKVCGRCAADKNIPIDMTRAPAWSSCDECQQHSKTYRRMDNEEKAPNASGLTLERKHDGS